MTRPVIRLLSGVILLLFISPVKGLAMTTCKATQLQCEYFTNPLGVDVPHPRLSWIIESSQRGQSQTSYRIMVASNREILANGKGDLWDSGRVQSNRSLQVPYAGKPLQSYQEVFWKVRIWDIKRSPSEWSTPAKWVMGLMRKEDWKAHWITAQTLRQREYPQTKPDENLYETLLLRREFHVKGGLKRALVTVCGLGQYEMSLNGNKVGNALFTPGWSKYDKTCIYDTYDVTSLLKQGVNTAGLFLGNGMYDVHAGRYTKFLGAFGPLKTICQIMLVYNNGKKELIGTGSDWRAASGPITFSSIYGGEDFDARLNPTGWRRSGFDDSSWDHTVITEGPGGALRGLSCSAPPIRAFQALTPIYVKKISPEVNVYDLGQNASLMPRIEVSGPSGSAVKIIPAELVKKDGTVDRSSCGGGEAYWKYTLKGEGKETWFPKFFYQGCRYLQVELTSPAGALPKLKSLKGIVIHSSSEPTGDFACSNKLFNRINTIIRWAQLNNMVSVLTDCPHRERLGWLEQDHLNGPSLRYDFDLRALYSKIINDMADSQLPDGLIPDIAPEYVVFDNGFRDSSEWGSAFILCAWQQYKWADDTRLLKEHYADMAKYMDFLESKASDNILSYGLSDWYDIGGNTPMGLTATAFYFDDLQIMEKIALLLGKTNDAHNFARLKGQVRTAFNRTFFDPQTLSYRNGGQTANSIALVMGIVEPKYRTNVLNAIVKDIQKRSYTITAGDVGYRYLLLALAGEGRSDVIYKLNNQSDKPGYGFQIKQGATSLTEAWDASRSSSQDHFMLGQIMEWFYHDLAGISEDSSEPGFSRIVIKPTMIADLKWVKAHFDSPHGRIISYWQRSKHGIIVDITIPANTTATVYLPAKSAKAVTESGIPVNHARGVRFLSKDGHSAVFTIESGSYHFNVRN